MKRARMIVLGIAVAAAGGAALLANGLLKPSKQVVKVNLDTVQVLVAKADLHLGDSLKSGDLKWQEWPKEAATKGYIVQAEKPNAMADYTGAIVRANFLAGEPVKDSKVIKKGDGGVMAAILPAGMRAISTAIREETAAGGFILPNDRVDVIVTRKARGQKGEQHVSDTLFRNVRILAIGQELDVRDDKKKTTIAKTATLELNPQQAEALALAKSMGDISLVLRSLADQIGAGQQPEGGEGAFKVEQSSTVRVLRYGSWSRASGVD